MERKFLVFSCVALLISILYFIFTTVKDQPLTKNQREPSKELGETSFSTGNLAKQSSSRDSSPSHQKSSDPTAEEWQAFEEAHQGSPEESIERGEEAQSASASGVEKSDTGISPELEAVFITVNQWRRRIRDLHRETGPLVREIAALSDRVEAINDAFDGTSGEENRRLNEEFKQAISEQQKVVDLVAPIDKEIEQVRQELEQYLQTNLGMTATQFYDTHGETFNTWRKAQ